MDLIGNINPVLDNALRSCLIDDCTVYGYISPNSCIVIGPVGIVIISLVEGNVSFKEGRWRREEKVLMGLLKQNVDVKEDPSNELSESYHKLKHFLVTRGHHVRVTAILVFSDAADLNNIDTIKYNKILKLKSLSSFFAQLLLTRSHLLRPNLINKLITVMDEFINPAATTT